MIFLCRMQLNVFEQSEEAKTTITTRLFHYAAPHI
jgi:hypothetical protein